MNNPKRLRLILFTLLTVVASLSPVGLLRVAQSQSAQTVLTLWTRYPTDLIKPNIDTYNAKLKAEGKNVRVEHTSIDHDAFVARLTEAVKEGKAPDLVAFDLIDGPRYSAIGAFLDLTDRFNSLTYKESLQKAMLRLGTWHSRIYALPAVAIVSVLFYNRKLFKEAGLDPNKPPTTWDELLADAQKLTKNGVIGYELWCGQPNWSMFTLMPYIWANGGKFLSDDGTKAMLDDPKTVETVQFFADLANKYKATWPTGTAQGCADDGDPSDPIRFDKGTVAMAPRASDVLGQYIQNEMLPDSKGAERIMDVALFPGKTPGSHSAFIGGDLIGITARSAYPDEAWDFIQYLLSAKSQSDPSALRAGFVPVRTDLIDNPVYAADPRYKVFAQALEVGYVPFTTVYHDLYAPFQVGIRAALLGEKPVAEALRDANAIMQKIIDAW